MRAFAILLALLAGGCVEAHPSDFRDTALRLDLEGGGICSGTAVSSNLVLTAQHCTDSGPILAINGQPARALKIVKDGHDHVLVRVTMQFKHWAKVGRGPLTGDKVRWIGMPAGNDNVYREGYVARNYSDETWLDALAFGGDSGAGVMCADGRLCGVVSAGKIWVRGEFTFAVTVLYPLGFTAKDWQAIR
jgi:V8-like Glu-specific endopeptidase